METYRFVPKGGGGKLKPVDLVMGMIEVVAHDLSEAQRRIRAMGIEADLWGSAPKERPRLGTPGNDSRKYLWKLKHARDSYNNRKP